MATTAIEWADAVWNPVTGCDRVSPGCAHCYALELAPRLRRFAQARGSGKWLNVRDGGKTSGPAFGVTLHPDVLEEPLHWPRPRRVFVNSMSDLFHEEIPDEFILRVFDVMERAEQHTFQVLTKRPERMAEAMHRYYRAVNMPPLPNLWLGVSIENRRYVDRADLLRETPAAVRFVSAEPLLGPLVHPGHPSERAYQHDPEPVTVHWADGHTGPELDLAGIDWLIVGGESGPHHRPTCPEWVRNLRDAALAECTAFFFKQWGGRTPKAGGRELDGRTWDEMPARAVTA
jgi:protein gp37